MGNKRNRRSLKRNKNKAKEQKLTFVGVNCAGLNSKLNSLDSLISQLNAIVIFFTRVKHRKQGKIGAANLKNYQVYQLIRKNSQGGGMAIAAHKDLNPIWLGEGNDETEVLSVQISVQEMKIRCVNAYGPQESAPVDIKDKFWKRLSFEANQADLTGAGFILEMDGNLWAGPELIPNDPNPMNKNGKYLKQFLDENENLVLVNSQHFCHGLITRLRKTVIRTEKAVLDFFIVCNKILPFIIKMLIDEDRKFSLTNFNGKVKDSDHFTLILEVNLSLQRRKKQRMEMFNFKNQECQELFHRNTSNRLELLQCFNNENSVVHQGDKWFQVLNNIFHESFSKIRITNKVKETEVSKLMKQRTDLKSRKDVSIQDEVLDLEIEILEKKISKLVAEENRNKVFNNFENLANTDGSTNTNGMWKLKKQIFPKNPPSLPSAKKDSKGNLISSHEELKKLYIKTYENRLRHRPMADDMDELKILKEELCSKRLELASMTKSAPWTEANLSKVLLKLKNNKSRDPHLMIREIFKPGVIGSDLKSSMLMLCNRIKEDIKIPAFMEWANIISIYKGKGDKLDLNNDRGIFIVNIFRSILMKLVYNDKYPTVDSNMSDSNVGARRGKGVRNHLFIVHGVINEVIQDKSKSLDIGILDYRQCFDSMWLEDTINDLYEAGITDDKLALIYKSNETNKVAVKTPSGMTERIEMKNLVLQGEIFGPLECSVSVDKFGKECLEEQKHLYSYRGLVGIPPLAMIDDLFLMAGCGLPSVLLNAFINAKTKTKKLQFGVEKCHKLHVGKQNSFCPDLYVDNWKLEEVEQIETGITSQQEYLEEDCLMETKEDDKYLGDIIMNNGKNTKNIKARTDKGEGIRKQIVTMLEDVCFGPFEFEVACIWRNSLFLNSILSNSEAWYNLGKNDIDHLEQSDEQLLRSILEAGKSTPKIMLYLEMGCLPIRFILMKRRINFLHLMLHENKDSLLFKFLVAQKSNPIKGDWCRTVEEDLQSLGLELSYDQIYAMSEYSLTNLLNKQSKIKALEYLNNEKKSKTKHIIHRELILQPYLKPGNMSNIQRKFIFKLRSRMLDVKVNFPGTQENLLCELCGEHNDDQESLLVCEKLDESNSLVTKSPDYKDLFSSHVDKQLEISLILKRKFELRKKLLKLN